MAHPAQKQYCNRVKDLHPQYFTNAHVLDCGSLHVNGNNRYLFEGGSYWGIDVGPGRNVDQVCPAHLHKPLRPYDVVISTEMLEHDQYLTASLQNMVRILRPGGLLLLTCAGADRLEHGTEAREPGSSPHTNHYYLNVLAQDLIDGLQPDKNFTAYEISYDGTAKDLRFWGIKKDLSLDEKIAEFKKEINWED